METNLLGFWSYRSGKIERYQLVVSLMKRGAGQGHVLSGYHSSVLERYEHSK